VWERKYISQDNLETDLDGLSTSEEFLKEWNMKLEMKRKRTEG
jgi:hypothetical protein